MIAKNRKTGGNVSREKLKKGKKHTKTLSSDSSSKKKKKKHGSKSSSSKKSPRKGEARQEEPTALHKIVSFLFNLLFYVITIGLILSAILFAFNGNEEKHILGYQVFNVKTNSMVPRDPAKQKGGFKAGDVIIIKKVPDSAIKEGDIVTFHPNKKSPTYLTHRVVKIVDELNGLEGPFMITQGDANLTEDSPTPLNQVVGKKVVSIPKLGVLLQFIREHFVVTIVFVLSLFGSILLLKIYLGNPAENEKKKNKTRKKKKTVHT